MKWFWDAYLPDESKRNDRKHPASTAAGSDQAAAASA